MQSYIGSQQFISRLRAIRESKKVSAQALTDSTGIPRSVITNMENGRREGISLDEAISLCNALGVDFAAVVRNEPIPTVVVKPIGWAAQ